MHRTGIGESFFGQKIRSILCVRRAANHVYAGCVGVRTICAGELSGIRTDVGQNMVVTVIGRCRAGCKIFGICHVAARIVRTYAVDGKLSGFFADGSSDDAVRFFKVRIRKILVNPAHDRFPDLLRIGGLSAVLNRIVVVTAPYHAGVIRCESGKQGITVLGGGTGFSCLRHAASEVGRRTGSLCHDVLHGVGQKPCSGLLQDGVRFRCRIVKQYISVMIQNSCIEFWLDVGSAVGDGGVSGGQLQVGDTVGETSECQCLIAALVDADGGKTKVADVIVTQGRTDLRQRLNRYDVDGINDTFAQCGETAVALVVVIYRSALSGTVIVRRIILDIGKCETSRVQCRCIGSDNLKGGTRLSCGVRCTV